MSASGFSLYQAAEINSMSPARRVVFLYTHLVANLRQARKAMADGRIEARAERLIKAVEIVDELLEALNREAGGELADRLAGLYAFFIRQIIHIDRTQDSAALNEVIDMVTSLHDAWVEAADQVESPLNAAVGA